LLVHVSPDRRLLGTLHCYLRCLRLANRFARAQVCVIVAPL
jgi:hypothetical protein